MQKVRAVLFLIAVCFFVTLSNSVFAQPVGERINISTDGTISSQVQSGNVLFIGGMFDQIAVESSSPEPRRNIAEILVSEETLSPWQPAPNNRVEDMVMYKNTIIIGGLFTTFSASEQPYLIFLDTNTKLRVEKNISLDGPVRALALDNSIVYVGGEFKTVNGTNQQSVFSFDLETDLLTKWNPNVTAPIVDIVVNDEYITLISEGSVGKDQTPSEVIVDKNIGNPIVPSTSTSQSTEGLQVSTEDFGFEIPTLSTVLTFGIRAFFVIAGLVALFYMLLGALAWITSGGDKDGVTAAREKIQAAVVGVIMVVVVLALVWTLEQVIFKRRICFGLSCPITIPSIIEPI